MRWRGKKKPSTSDSRRPPLVDDEKKRLEFDTIIKGTKGLLLGVTTATQQALVFQFVIDQLGKEISVDSTSKILRCQEPPDNRYYDFQELFPGNILEGIEKQNVDVSKCNVYTGPWEISRMSNALNHIFTNGFHKSLGYYDGAYFPEINYAVIANGRHHSTAGVFAGDCVVSLYVFPLSPFFQTVTTDGAYFYYEKDWRPYQISVADPRLAAMYRLAQMREEMHLEIPEPLPSLDEEPEQNYDPHRLLFNEIRYWKDECEALNKIVGTQKGEIRNLKQELQALKESLDRKEESC